MVGSGLPWPAIGGRWPSRLVATAVERGGLHMSTESSNNLSREAPQWMKDMFQELKNMFEGLFPDADELNLEEMQRSLDEQQAHSEQNSQ
jgi:hypothetical protein